jgi:hypothetical protein
MCAKIGAEVATMAHIGKHFQTFWALSCPLLLQTDHESSCRFCRTSRPAHGENNVSHRTVRRKMIADPNKCRTRLFAVRTFPFGYGKSRAHQKWCSIYLGRHLFVRGLFCRRTVKQAYADTCAIAGLLAVLRSSHSFPPLLCPLTMFK